MSEYLCEGVISESSETVLITHDTLEGPASKPEVVVTPEHPCDRPATRLSRSMIEVNPSEWRPTEDHLWCDHCYRPGTMTHLDGTITEHGYMSPSEYRGDLS